MSSYEEGAVKCSQTRNNLELGWANELDAVWVRVEVRILCRSPEHCSEENGWRNYQYLVLRVPKSCDLGPGRFFFPNKQDMDP